MKRILRSVTFPSVLILLTMLVSSTCLFGQSRTVTGIVKSGTDVLPGVTVLEKGTNNGTVTDSEGKFTIAVSGNATLVISFVGMRPQEIQVNNQASIDVNLEADVTQLSEVVVIGYGTAKKSDLTGSIASVSGDDLKKMPVSTVAETLTGRMPGVNVTSTEGSPDAEVRIRVRGGTSLTQDNSPLFIVDGFPVRSINDISPSDIKSIDVLKDASSTAIYGSRGANGVVIITTKGGNTDGKISVSYNAFGGVKRLAKELDVLSSSDYAKWQYEMALLKDDLPSYEDYFGSYTDIDLYSGFKGNNWQQQVYGRTGKVFSNDLSVRGGNEKLNFSVNYARFQEKAIMIGSDYKRDNITLKLNGKPTDKIDLGFTMRYSQTEINGSGANEQNEVSSVDSRLKHSVTYSPIPLQGITTDDTNEAIANYMINPLTATADNDRSQERRNFNVGGGFGWKIIDNLQLRVEGGIDTYNSLDNRFYGRTTYFVKNRPALENQNKPAAVLSDRKEYRLRNTNTLSYDFKDILKGDHHLNVLVGQEMLKYQNNRLTSELHGFPTLFSAADAFKLTTQGAPVSIDNFYDPDDKLISFFTRVNYDFKGRYLLTAVYRADGSSKFLGNNRWGYFPSLSAAWKISEEGFMRGTSSWMNMLKLRVSYGEAGNNNIPTGQTAQNFASSVPTWLNDITKIWTPSRTMANPDLKWETTITRNIGLDFGLMQGRLTGTAEIYKNNTQDLLIQFLTPGSGYDNQYRNVGEIENKGLELSFTYAAIDREKYGLNFTFNVSFNRNEIISLGGLQIPGTSNWASTAIGQDYRVNVGRSLGIMYGYQNAGRYEVSDFEGYDAGTGLWTLKAGVSNNGAAVGNGASSVAPGMMKLKDQLTVDTNGDGIPDAGDGVINANDQVLIGNANPKHTGGFIINGYAYGFDLTASFNWSFGNDIYNANKIEYTSSLDNQPYRNLIDIMEDGKRWTNLDPATGSLVTDPTQLAAMNANTTMWSPYMNRNVFSDWAVEDGSFLRLNTLTLGYTLPSSITSKANVKSLRLYLTGYNVFVITNYSGFDPEVSTRRNTPYTPGVDYSAYPRSRQFVAGLTLNF